MNAVLYMFFFCQKLRVLAFFSIMKRYKKIKKRVEKGGVVV